MSSTGCTREGGASSLYPDKWDEFIALIPEDERGDLIEAYRKRLTSDDADEQLRCAKAWSMWEGDHRHRAPASRGRWSISQARKSRSRWPGSRTTTWRTAAGSTKASCSRARRKLRDIPGVIVQGRHDCCTPPRAAWELKKAWPEVDLQIVPDGGHLFNEPGILDGLVRATDKFASA